MENYDEHYIANNYDIDDENVLIIKNSKMEAGDDDDRNLYHKANIYISNEDMSNPSNYKQANKLLDIENFIWYAAFNIYIGNRNSVFQANNWAMWRVRDSVKNVINGDGKWRFLSFDNDLSAGLFGNEREYNNILFSDIFNEVSQTSKCIGSKLLNSLLKNSNFKNMFINALCDIRNIDFEANRVNEYIEELYSIIQPLMKDNFIRFGPQWVLYGPEEHYNKQINTFKTWLNLRYDNFLNNTAKYFEFESPVEVSITSNDFEKGSFIVNNGWKIFEEEYNGLYFTDNILHLSANPLEGEFEYWEVKNCQSVENSDEIDFKSKDINLSINPLEGCSIVAYYS